MDDVPWQPEPDELGTEEPPFEFNDVDQVPETDPLLDEIENIDEGVPEPPAPIQWDLLTAEEAEFEWYALNEWVHWYRKRFSLPAATVAPFWHRHPEMLEELSALHLHYLGSYHRDQDGSGPLGWLNDSAVTQKRLRELVTIAGTKLDRDRETRPTIWPGETPAQEIRETSIDDREADFFAFVEVDLEHRRQLQRALSAMSEEEHTL